jgi:hypothetical protein
MRIYEITSNNSRINNLKAQAKEVVDNCQPFLSKLLQPTTSELWRGVNAVLPDFEVYYNKSNRQPRNTDVIIHNLADKWLEANCGNKYRSNAVFVTGRKRDARDYGNIYRFYPKGHFTFCWSPLVNDMTTDLLPSHYFEEELANADSTLNEKVEQQMAAAKYQTTNLNAAIASNHEIMSHCEQYYLVTDIVSYHINQLLLEKYNEN